jgi:hypothetical protein
MIRSGLQTRGMIAPTLAALILVAAFSAEPVNAQICNAKYLVQARSNLVITAFRYLLRNGTWSQNLLFTAIQPGRQQLITVQGNGPSQFEAVLSGDIRVVEQVKNPCAASEIVIFEEFRKYQMVVR